VTMQARDYTGDTGICVPYVYALCVSLICEFVTFFEWCAFVTDASQVFGCAFVTIVLAIVCWISDNAFCATLQVRTMCDERN